ncbi:hypothetical protein GCM10023336_66430 [Streptomyces similanensis]|uniref:Uncharacterized protein n=1 Tax=Streptomyces similanensis TaxID=1274988 RepID=A0ABP9LDR4_9ACTN
MVGDRTVHDGPDDGVQAGAVAAGREDTNAHSPNNLLHMGTGPDRAVRLDPRHPNGSRGAALRVRPPAGRGRSPVRKARQTGWSPRADGPVNTRARPGAAAVEKNRFGPLPAARTAAGPGA